MRPPFFSKLPPRLGYYGVVDDENRNSVNPRRDLVLLAILIGAVIVAVVLYLIV